MAVVTVAGDHIPGEGYVTFKAIQAFTSRDGSCRQGASVLTPYGPGAAGPGAAGPLAGWAILQDVSTGFFCTELPVVTALIDSGTGVASGGLGAVGLMPAGNAVVVRYDVNPAFGLGTELFVWLASNARDVQGTLVRTERVAGFLQCEYELQISTPLLLPDEVNVLNPAPLGRDQAVHPGGNIGGGGGGAVHAAGGGDRVEPRAPGEPGKPAFSGVLFGLPAGV